MQTATTHTDSRPFLELTAADLMTTPVITIAQETPLRQVAHLLTSDRISGAPVVDSEGRCIGVLSSSDFVTWADKEGDSEESNNKGVHFLGPWGEIISIDESPHDEIRKYMTAQPVAVAPTTPIGELAQKMVDAHIHRVLVVVDRNRPQGIVTSTDILAAVARAAQRAALEKESRPSKRNRT